MRSKSTVVLLLLLAIVVFILFKQNYQLDVTPTKEQTLSETENKQLIVPDEDNQPESKLPHVVKQQSEMNLDKNSDLISSVDDYIYDPDPFVETQMMLHENELCYNYISTKQSSKFSESLKRMSHRLQEQQSKFFDEHFEYCDKLNMQKPRLQLDNHKEVKERLKQSQPNSLWGKILSGDVEVDTLNHSQIKDLLKQNRLSVLSLAPKIFYEYYEEVVHWDMEYVLQNRNYDYVKLVQDYAQELYLCNLGRECGPNSQFMIRMCLTSQQACGLNYNQYIENILTTGQQSDLQTALQYFENSYR
ncbi:MAG TPA: hypothetical protein PK055_09330 [Gammaproteobacteria bacterium]|nr:hypothetical protein [Xanthomonadales bacterium]MCB1594457.1 hypothetical protein [Xanthomonadales bacterium]HOP22197.1 hypothetical protein [Gammaproteobacteria bacterium]HPI96494.1 hypothetical protein [Gammaproteobacteria bacterium]HPQ87846.1 hypothetical protein [Gammaproteobacteria bacterium]